MKIAINLLPNEFRQQDIENAKFYKIQTIGVIVILFMIFLASIIVSLRILQSKNISLIQSKVSESEQKISSLKTTESSLFLLKNRLTTIDKYLDNPSAQSEIYNLIVRLLPPAVSVSSISVNKSSEVLLLATIADSDSLDGLVNNLISKESNQNRISQISLENINRSKDGSYRVSLKIKTK